MEWTVSRQHYYYSDELVVEIVQGRDCSGPDALMAKYRDEFALFEDPREVVEAAIKIAEQWQADCPGDEILIANGNTLGGSLELEGAPLNEETFAGLREWAQKQYDAIPKCNWCGDPICGSPFIIWEFGDDYQFCSHHCAEEAYCQRQEEDAAELAEGMPAQ